MCSKGTFCAEIRFNGGYYGYARHASKLTGFITVPDTRVPAIDTPNGKVGFVEFIGATDAELVAIQNKKLTVRELFEKIGDVTDFNRDSIV